MPAIRASMRRCTSAERSTWASDGNPLTISGRVQSAAGNATTASARRSSSQPRSISVETQSSRL
jgi:hypothetical protein